MRIGECAWCAVYTGTPSLFAELAFAFPFHVRRADRSPSRAKIVCARFQRSLASLDFVRRGVWPRDIREGEDVYALCRFCLLALPTVDSTFPIRGDVFSYSVVRSNVAVEDVSTPFRTFCGLRAAGLFPGGVIVEDHWPNDDHVMASRSLIGLAL